MAEDSKRFQKHIIIEPDDTALSIEGEVAYDASEEKLKYRDSSATQDIASEGYVDTAVGASTSDIADLRTTQGTSDGDVDLGTFTGSTISDAGTVKAGIQELETAHETLDASVTDIDGNVNDLITLSGVAENATDLGTFTGSIISDNVVNKVALQEIETQVGTNITGISDHLADASDAHDASAISNVAAGNIIATDVQSAIDELDSDKLALAGGTMTGDIVLVGDPTLPNHPATKSYVDSSASQDWKGSVALVAVSNITLSGEQTIDSVLTSSSDVLVQNQSTASENGIYTSASGAWTRRSDADSASKLNLGARVYVEAGTLYVKTLWNITSGTFATGVVFTQNSGLDQLVGGDGIAKSGNSISFDISDTNITKDEDTMSSDSAVHLATQQSIKAYADTKVSEISGTDNALIRNDGTSGAIQDSGIIIDDSDNIDITYTGASSKTIKTANDSTADANNTDNVLIKSGDKGAGTGDSGNISFQTGTSSGGSRGAIAFLDGSEGTDGHVWTQNGTTGLGNWEAAATAGVLSVANKTTTYTATTGDNVITADASSAGFTITLYTAASNTGRTLYIKKTDSSTNFVTIDGDGTETIDGETTFELRLEYDSVLLVSDGTNWQILSDKRTMPIAMVYDEKADGTQGGTFTSGAWRDRDLNTISGDEDAVGVSLSSNAMSLPKGKFKISWSMPANTVQTFISQLYNVTGTATESEGSSGHSKASGITTFSKGSTIVDIAAATEFKIRGWCQTTRVNDGFGADSDATDTEVEVYTQVEIMRLK